MINGSCGHEIHNPLTSLGIQKASEDIFYDVHITEARPLKLIFERTKEWVMVKSSDVNESGVRVGSILHQINAESIMNFDHDSVINLLRDWRPPLHLTFRQAPEKAGWLFKRSLLTNSTGHVNASWKKKYVVVREGRLVIADDENLTDASKVRGEIPFIASSVSLLPFAETGKCFTFKVNHGVMSIVLQAASIEEMNDWTSLLSHAISLANGGTHILRAAELWNSRSRSESFDFDADMDTEDFFDEDENYCDNNNNNNNNSNNSNSSSSSSNNGSNTSKKRPSQSDDADGGEGMSNGDDEEVDGMRESVKRNRSIDEFNNTTRDGDKENMSPDTATAVVDENMINLQAGNTASVGNESADVVISKLFNLPIVVENQSISLKSYRETHEPADDKELANMFNKISKALNNNNNNSSSNNSNSSSSSEDDVLENRYINVMQFSTIFRLVTGEKGNLFKEMQTYNKFNVSGNGAMTERDFVDGWIKYSRSRNDDDCILRRIKFIVSA